MLRMEKNNVYIEDCVSRRTVIADVIFGDTPVGVLSDDEYLEMECMLMDAIERKINGFVFEEIYETEDTICH